MQLVEHAARDVRPGFGDDEDRVVRTPLAAGASFRRVASVRGGSIVTRKARVRSRLGAVDRRPPGSFRVQQASYWPLATTPASPAGPVIGDTRTPSDQCLTRLIAVRAR
jgi:hypothetical protein